jgi:hypothetical protein
MPIQKPVDGDRRVINKFFFFPTSLTNGQVNDKGFSVFETTWLRYRKVEQQYTFQVGFGWNWSDLAWVE